MKMYRHHHDSIHQHCLPKLFFQLFSSNLCCLKTTVFGSLRHAVSTDMSERAAAPPLTDAVTFNLIRCRGLWEMVLTKGY